MKLHLLPSNVLGRWSLGLIIAMPALFFLGSSFTNSLYKSVPGGGTIWEDINTRPALALTMLAGMISGILAFITGILSIIIAKEKSLFVYVATMIGTFLILFLINEVLFPH